MIPHNLPTFGIEEQAATTRVLSSGWVAQGIEVEAFENELCDFLNLPHGHALAVSSGTAALYLALWVLNGKERRIGMPTYACSALRNAAGLIGGEPVYLDCVEGTPNVDASAAGSANIDILIAPSMYGVPVSLPAQQDVKVIEDIAQSLGAISQGERIGLRGDVGICSFFATKMITTGGQGGAVISKNKALIDELRDFREFDSREDTKLRFNFQMTDLHAAVGRAQLRKIPALIRRREHIFQIYRSEGLNLIDSTSVVDEPVRYRAVIYCEKPEKLIQALADEGVKAIVPIEEWELLNKSKIYKNANLLTKKTVSIPIYPLLKDSQAMKIAKIGSFFI